MTKHPYPDRIRQTVATTIGKQILVFRDWDGLDWQTQEAFLSDADEVLQALWDASHLEDYDQLNDIPETSVVLPREGDACTPYDMFHKRIPSKDFPAHVIFWGDHDG